MSEREVPTGFENLYRESNYVQLLGPLYHKRDGTGHIIGLRIAEKHCNTRGDVHGGVLSSIADTAMGYNVAFSEEPPTSAVTASLTVDYLGRAAVGDWLEAHVNIEKKGKRLTFVTCTFYAGETYVGRASGVFHMLQKRVQTSI
ncbi:PaaI family thioesterase [Aurantivibrio plasticivorans]